MCRSLVIDVFVASGWSVVDPKPVAFCNSIAEEVAILVRDIRAGQKSFTLCTRLEVTKKCAPAKYKQVTLGLHCCQSM